jgi:uncharacterized ion transporter superfamily protein YfcC
LTGYVLVAAITGSLSVEVLAIRLGMAVVTAALIGLAYRRRPATRHIEGIDSGEASLTRRRACQWRLLMWIVFGLVVIAFVIRHAV